MNRDEGKVGMKVLFGRSNGQQTLGEIVKVNPRKFKVKQLEERGVRKSHSVGTVWTVPPSLCTPARADNVVEAMKHPSPFVEGPPDLFTTKEE